MRRTESSSYVSFMDLKGERSSTEAVDVVVIGAGQAGLAAGYHLSSTDRSFVILDSSERVGDVWRKRWESLSLFTPAEFNGLPGLSFPAPPKHFPTKADMADSLEAYVERFDLPVRLRTTVTPVARPAHGHVVETGDLRSLPPATGQ